MMDRRGLITGLIAFAAATPAIVKASSLMVLPRRPLLDVRLVLANGGLVPMTLAYSQGEVRVKRGVVFCTAPFWQPETITHLEVNTGRGFIRRLFNNTCHPLTGDTVKGVINPDEWRVI